MSPIINTNTANQVSGTPLGPSGAEQSENISSKADFIAAVEKFVPTPDENNVAQSKTRARQSPEFTQLTELLDKSKADVISFSRAAIKMNDGYKTHITQHVINQTATRIRKGDLTAFPQPRLTDDNFTIIVSDWRTSFSHQHATPYYTYATTLVEMINNFVDIISQSNTILDAKDAALFKLQARLAIGEVAKSVEIESVQIAAAGAAAAQTNQKPKTLDTTVKPADKSALRDRISSNKEWLSQLRKLKSKFGGNAFINIGSETASGISLSAFSGYTINKAIEIMETVSSLTDQAIASPAGLVVTGDSALHKAVAANSFSRVKKLIENGADPFTGVEVWDNGTFPGDKGSANAFDIARRLPDNKILKFMMDRFADKLKGQN